MTERSNEKPGSIDDLVSHLGGSITGAMLDRIDKAVAWDKLVKPIAALPEYKGKEGTQPAWSAITMLKCLLLAKLFGLTDLQLEDCLEDRVSVRRFVGISLADATPDEATFSRFRARLRERHLELAILDSVLSELEANGLVLREGRTVDAEIINRSSASPGELSTQAPVRE